MNRMGLGTSGGGGAVQSSMVRISLLAVGLALGLTPFAQAQLTPEAATQNALAGLRMHPSAWLRMDGQDTVGSVANRFIGDLYWYSSFDALGLPVAKAELQEFLNGNLRVRTVGDGVTLWHYDLARFAYNATTYGTFSGSPPPTYLTNLIKGMGTHAEGQTTHLVRLIRETYDGGFAQFKPWIVGGASSLLTGGQSMDDPVLGNQRTYVSSAAVEYAVFWTGQPANRSLAFEIISDPKFGGKIVNAVYYASVSAVGNQSRLVEWTMMVRPDVIPAASNFVFVPPAGAKPIPKTGGSY
ncbi:MAG: hypothetical protein HRU74_01800 [Chthonomonadaceae bacterium]|nr:MAG: hypothetical protein HRU74_01800 [Chthonomonadaceae bacterium]